MPTSTTKYIIHTGKFARWATVDGVPKVVTKRHGDILDLTPEEAQAKQASIRLATAEEIAAYEARLRGEGAAPPIPAEHVSTAGAPPAQTPAHGQLGAGPLPSAASAPGAQRAPGEPEPAAPAKPAATPAAVPAAAIPAPAPPVVPAAESGKPRARSRPGGKKTGKGK